MQGPAFNQVLWLTLGGVVAGVGLVLAAWALLRDRRGKGPRCPKCWYDMSGIAGLRCPECGRTAKSSRALHRRRRRYGGLLLGVVLVAASSQVLLQPQRTREGWTRWIPTTALAAG